MKKISNKENKKGPEYFFNHNKEAILEVIALKKYFMSHKKSTVVKALDGVSFQLYKGEILAIVGESGCGKTTTGKLIMRLLEPTDGEVILNAYDPSGLSKKEETIEYRKHIQMIFQDPYSSINPHYKVRAILEEPLLVHRLHQSRKQRMEVITEVLTRVKLTPVSDFIDRFPHMLSGGQRQRLATARTLVLRPQVIVADEPVSMIDLSTRAEILHLIKLIKADMELSFIYITHDISTARYFADRIAVMYLGKIVEIGSQDELIDSPVHPYTRALINAVCETLPNRANVQKIININDEISSNTQNYAGCNFAPRCIFANDECRKDPEPELVEISPGHLHACKRWKEIPPK